MLLLLLLVSFPLLAQTRGVKTAVDTNLLNTSAVYLINAFYGYFPNDYCPSFIIDNKVRSELIAYYGQELHDFGYWGDDYCELPKTFIKYLDVQCFDRHNLSGFSNVISLIFANIDEYKSEYYSFQRLNSLKSNYLFTEIDSIYTNGSSYLLRYFRLPMRLVNLDSIQISKEEAWMSCHVNSHKSTNIPLMKPTHVSGRNENDDYAIITNFKFSKRIIREHRHESANWSYYCFDDSGMHRIISSIGIGQTLGSAGIFYCFEDLDGDGIEELHDFDRVPSGPTSDNEYRFAIVHNSYIWNSKLHIFELKQTDSFLDNSLEYSNHMKKINQTAKWY
jgi:hypothetical protein